MKTKTAQSPLGLAIVLGMLVACGGPAAESTPVVAVPSPTPVVAETATTLDAWKAFTSERYGYTMSCPADWFVGEKEGEWKHGQPLYADTPGRDLFGSVKANYHVNVAAEALSAPTTPDEWEAMVVADMQLPSSCGDPKTIEKTTLGGEPALKLTFSCSGDDVDIIFILAVHGQKGFAVAWDSPYGDESADQELFGRFLSGFAFTG